MLELLPVSALSDGLRDVLQHGAAMPWGDLGILAVWAVRRAGRGGPLLPLGVAGGRSPAGSAHAGAGDPS